MQVGEGRLALWLDSNELVIFEIEERVDPLAGLVAGLEAEGVTPKLAETAHEALVGCNECHSYEQNVHGAGPSLFRVAGRAVASTAFANYSSALQGLGGTWTQEALTAYLTSPETVAEGTTMTGLGVGDPEVARAMTQAFFWMATQRSSAR